jgi:hypothetical protein
VKAGSLSLTSAICGRSGTVGAGARIGGGEGEGIGGAAVSFVDGKASEMEVVVDSRAGAELDKRSDSVFFLDFLSSFDAAIFSIGFASSSSEDETTFAGFVEALCWTDTFVLTPTSSESEEDDEESEDDEDTSETSTEHSSQYGSC